MYPIAGFDSNIMPGTILQIIQCRATSYISRSGNILHTPILCLILRTTVTSLSVSKDIRCKKHPSWANPEILFWTREKTHVLRCYVRDIKHIPRWRHGCSRGETKYIAHSDNVSHHSIDSNITPSTILQIIQCRATSDIIRSGKVNRWSVMFKLGFEDV